MRARVLALGSFAAVLVARPGAVAARRARLGWMSHTHIERVRFGDLDAMRHLNNVVFLRYFETARIAYLRSLTPAHDPSNPEDGGVGFIFAECHIAYRTPVQFDEEVAINCTIGEIRRSSFRIDFQMAVGERTAAEGFGWLVGYDYATGTSRRLPPALLERLEGELAGA